MYAIKFISVALLVASVLSACENSADHKSTSQSAMSSTKTHEVADKTAELQLNAGEKWVINAEMKPFLVEAEVLLEDYVTSQSEDYQNLASQLKVKNGGLIKSCTMEGQSHDELHKWLYPHIELIEALTKAATLEEAKVIVADLQQSFLSFHAYFE